MSYSNFFFNFWWFSILICFEKLEIVVIRGISRGRQFLSTPIKILILFFKSNVASSTLFILYIQYIFFFAILALNLLHDKNQLLAQGVANSLFHPVFLCLTPTGIVLNLLYLIFDKVWNKKLSQNSADLMICSSEFKTDWQILSEIKLPVTSHSLLADEF